MLRGRIRELAAARVRYGYFRIYRLLRREGWAINHKRVYRLYRQDGLSMRLKRPRRRVMAAHRVARPAAGAINESWSMDFVSDALFDGRRIRALTVVDNFSRESLAIEVGQGITGEQVAAVMNRIVAERGAPKTIRVDNGPEFVSRALHQWAYLHQVTLDFSRPGKPTDNALVESFNGRVRDECLNTKLGASTITRLDLTPPWATFHPGNSLNWPRGTAAMNPDYSLSDRTSIRGTLRATFATIGL